MLECTENTAKALGCETVKLVVFIPTKNCTIQKPRHQMIEHLSSITFAAQQISSIYNCEMFGQVRSSIVHPQNCSSVPHFSGAIGKMLTLFQTQTLSWFYKLVQLLNDFSSLTLEFFLMVDAIQFLFNGTYLQGKDSFWTGTNCECLLMFL